MPQFAKGGVVRFMDTISYLSYNVIITYNLPFVNG